MGVDGSGKTTIAKKLNRTLNNSKYLHLKPYILFKDRRTVIKNPHNHKKKFFNYSFLRLISWLISYKVYFYTRSKNTVFIFDRYAHDILIDPRRYKHSLSVSLTKIILSFFPKPDLWIFLNPPIRTIKFRKQELSDKELKRQISSYISFFKNKKNVLVFKSISSKNKLFKDITKKINNFIK